MLYYPRILIPVSQINIMHYFCTRYNFFKNRFLSWCQKIDLKYMQVACCNMLWYKSRCICEHVIYSLFYLFNCSKRYPRHVAFKTGVDQKAIETYFISVHKKGFDYYFIFIFSWNFRKRKKSMHLVFWLCSNGWQRLANGMAKYHILHVFYLHRLKCT